MTPFDPATVADAVREEIKRLMGLLGVTGTTERLGPSKARRLRTFNMVAQQDPHVHATVHLLHDRHASEGDRTRRTKVEAALDDDLRPTAALTKAIEGVLRKHARLERRDQAIRAAGADPLRPPAWAFSHHDVMPAMLSMCRTSIDRMFSDCTYGAIPEGWKLRPAGGGGGMIYNAIKLIGDRLQIGEMHVQRGGTRTITLNQTRRSIIRLYDQAMPETMIQAMAGLPLRDVLRHPAFDKHETASVIHTAMRNETAGTIDLTLEERRLWPPAPDGIDTGWRQ